MHISNTPQIHQLGGTINRKSTNLNTILEESGSRNRSISNYEQEYSIIGNDKVKMNTTINEGRKPSPFKNLTNNNSSQVVVVNNRKFVKDTSKSPQRSQDKMTKMILNKVIKRDEVITEREMNLMKKVKSLEKRIAELHTEKQTYLMKTK